MHAWLVQDFKVVYSVSLAMENSILVVEPVDASDDLSASSTAVFRSLKFPGPECDVEATARKFECTVLSGGNC